MSFVKDGTRKPLKPLADMPLPLAERNRLNAMRNEARRLDVPWLPRAKLATYAYWAIETKVWPV